MKMRNASEMQLKAIRHVTGPARVIAGPGSGKTFTIVQRLLNLIIHHHVDPDTILTITFTRAAALEMQTRYLKETEKNPVFKSIEKSVHFGTFHSISFAILRESDLIRGFSLIKESEKRKIMEIILKNRKAAKTVEYDMISGVLDAVSRKKNCCEMTQYPSDLTEEEFENIYSLYVDMLDQQKLLDFDDMLLLCLKNLKENSSFCRKWQARFQYLLVDEFQDINEIQYQIIRLLAKPQNNLFVVGDDDQAIYGFRGASPGIMERFKEDYQEAAELFLTENYRSGSRIIELADQMIRRNEERFVKTPLPMKKGGNVRFCSRETRKEEEKSLLADLSLLSQEQLAGSAVIVRTNAEALLYTALLKQNRVPVRERRTGKGNPAKTAVAEDFKAFLKFVREGNKRKDFLLIFNKPNLYLSRQALTEEVVTEKGILTYYGNNKDMCLKIKTLFKHYNTAAGLSPQLAIRYFRKVMGYDDHLRQKAGSEDPDSLMKMADHIQELFGRMKPWEKVDEFFEKVQKDKTDVITFSSGISVITMHGAKGLEFHSVFLPDLNEGVIPGRNCRTKTDLEEERRLLYVAITRARESLYLYYTKERNRKPTRFLEGLIPRPGR